MREIANKVLEYMVPVFCIGCLLLLLITFLFRFTDKTILNSVAITPYPADTSINAIIDGSFQSAFGKYISDNFYGHTNAVKIHNQIEYSFFKDGSGDWIQGKDGYLFSRSQSYSFVGGEWANTAEYEEYVEYARAVAYMQDLLNANGKDFVYLITPMKAEVYEDYLPWYMQLIGNKYSDTDKSKHSMIVKAFEECGVNYYDVTEDLKKMRKEEAFDIFSSTGHHWTLTATAIEMEKILNEFESMSKFTEYPQVYVNGINDDFYLYDTDILDVQNVFLPNLADNYNSPIIEYESSDDNVYLYGTSFCGQISGALYQNVENRAFNRLVSEEYFTTSVTYDSSGSKREYYTVDHTPDDIGVMKYINDSNLIIMEQNGGLGIIEPHQKFVNYVISILEADEFSLTGNLLRNTTDISKFELVNFFPLEEWGRWTEGNECTLIVYEDLNSVEKNVYLEMNVSSFAVDQIVEIYLNNNLISTISITEEKHNFRIQLPKEYLLNNENRIQFELQKETVSPEAMGNTGDSRNLGLGFEKLTIIVGGDD